MILRQTWLWCALLWLAAGGASTGHCAEPPLPAPIVCKPVEAQFLGKADDFPPPPAVSRGYDVLTYDLDVRLDPAARSIAGQVVIGLASVAPAGLTTVQLDLVPELTVSEVSDAIGPLTYSHTASSLEVTLRQSLPAGVDTELTITWQGQPPRHGITRTGLMYRTHDSGTPADPSDDMPIVANKSQTWSAHSWWPCKDHPHDKALVRLNVTVPDNLSAVSNGSLIGITTPETGWRQYDWHETYPIPTYLVSVAVSNYVSWSEDCQPQVGPDVRLDYHVFPTDEAKARVDLAPTCDMMDFMTGLAGPWPFAGEKYAQVEFKWFGAMEHTTATSLGQALLTGDSRFESIYLHELAHQWFGDSLTPAVWADIWLNEGFARYTEALWAEHRQGQAAYDEFMFLIGPGSHPALFRGDGVLADPDPILPNTLVYDKGAWVLHMLRGLIGDDAFFDFLQSYARDARYMHGSVTVAEMIAVAETAAGRSLQNFFDPWLNTDAVPIISHLTTLTVGGNAKLTLRQNQTPIFEIPVPVVLHTTCADVRVTAALVSAEQTFQWDLDCEITAVSIAPEGLALMRNIGTPPPPLRVTGPAPNPSGPDGTQFIIILTNDAEVVVTVYNILGRKVFSENLGRLTGSNPGELPIAPGHPWRWHPAQATGPALASGLYYVEFSGGGGRQVCQVTLIR